MSEPTKLEVALPGEWALKKLLGPTLDEMGSDFQKLYVAGRDRITAAAARKTPDLDDGSKANLRVARDVFWNGSFSEDAICAEYFGGILASARSSDGRDDGSIYYLDIIKSLSSTQLKLHYCIYHSLNKSMVADSAKHGINPGLSNEIQTQKIYMFTMELFRLGVRIDLDFEVLFRCGLIAEYENNTHKMENGTQIPFAMAAPCAMGVQLYSVAFNKRTVWRTFVSSDFGDLEGIDSPESFGFNLTELENIALGVAPGR